ncbi:MAG: hypothetical protein GY730_01205 [bacterium]|nr:hypothetical protein [bacterium]
MNIIEELRLLGVQGTLFRLYYELLNRSSIRNILEKETGVPEISIDLLTWKKSRKPFYVSSADKLKDSVLSKINKSELNNSELEADNILKGKILCFSHWSGDYGYPVNWHYNPVKKVSWPEEVKSFQIMGFEKECGDIKLTWELNRFSHLYKVLRACVLTGDKKYISGFCDQLKWWEENNRYGFGANWLNGQELAIRMFAWISALYVMSDNDVFTEDDFQCFMRQVYLHTRHIEKNISYAYYAVHNNHLIGEALALYISGVLFPYFPESDRWKSKGKKILESDKCLKQFYQDGGYCQLSFTYQRLALHYYLWYSIVADLNGDTVSEEIKAVLDKSARFLFACMNDDGRLPNWGANDGALLNPWCICDYTDFRPLVQMLSYYTRGKRAFKSGLWDEEILWFFNGKMDQVEYQPYELKSQSFPETGVHILRKDSSNFMMLRCGTVNDRFGQADQLHTDIWWKGINIAVDGGSYLYNDELQYHRYFAGTRSHNTVTVDGMDQMYLHRRFKWLYWTRARLLSFSNSRVEGEHYGYKRHKAKAVHKRGIEIKPDGSYEIYDSLAQAVPVNVEYELHWLLADFPYEIEVNDDRQKKIRLKTVKGSYYLLIESDNDCTLIVNRAQDDVEYPDGWSSRYYGQKDPAVSVRLKIISSSGCQFKTIFKES